MTLAGQTALITGASGGIGRAIALGIAAERANVWLVGRRESALRKVADAVAAAGGRAQVLAVDLAADDAIGCIADAVRSEGIDILVHSAGVIESGPVAQAPTAAFDRQYMINVRVPYALTQSLLPHLRQRQGQIVFINSSVGIRARAGVSQYAATKHALRAVADSLREEVNRDGVRVLSVYPGRTASAMQEAIFAAENRPYDPLRLLQPQDVAAMVLNALKLPRTAEVTDIFVRPLRDASS